VRASIKLGVTTVASGKSCVTSASIASSSSSVAPDEATITGSTTSGTRWAARKPATASITRREKSIPVFAASTPDVGEDRSELLDDEFRRHFVHRGHANGALRRQRDNRRHAVAAGRGERLQVGLDAGAASAVGAGDREQAWNGQTVSLRRHDPDQVRRV